MTDADILARLAPPLNLDLADPRILERRLVEDLGFDSIDMVEALYLVEEMTGEFVTPELFEAMATVHDLVAWTSNLRQNTLDRS